jgi:hypothetical protein
MVSEWRGRLPSTGSMGSLVSPGRRSRASSTDEKVEEVTVATL